MKKILVVGSIFILLGFFVGNKIFSQRIEVIKKIKENTYYFLEEDVNKTETTQKVISQNEENYRYMGITKNYILAGKIKQLYEDKGYKLIIKEKNLKNEEFSHNVSQFDILLKEANSFEEISSIEKIVLSNYDDLINNPNILE